MNHSPLDANHGTRGNTRAIFLRDNATVAIMMYVSLDENAKALVQNDVSEPATTAKRMWNSGANGQIRE